MVSRPFILFYVSAIFSLLLFSCSSKTPGSSGQSLNPKSLILTLALPIHSCASWYDSQPFLSYLCNTHLPPVRHYEVSIPSTPVNELFAHFFVLPDISVVSNPADHCLLPTLLLCSCLCYSLCWLPVFLWLIFLQPSQYWCLYESSWVVYFLTIHILGNLISALVSQRPGLMNPELLNPGQASKYLLVNRLPMTPRVLIISLVPAGKEQAAYC